MGCDIHATIEYKKDGIDFWRCFAKDVDIQRSYYLFSILADVRNIYEEKIKPISTPRGKPENASYGFDEELESWDSDAHSISWVTFDELESYDTSYFKERWRDEFRKDNWYKSMELLARKHGDKNVRLVFFFDN